MVSIYTYHDSSAFEDLAGEWNALLRRSPSDTIFLTLEFQRTWWRCLGAGDLRILAMRNEAGEPVGLAPLYAPPATGGRVWAIVGCTEVADYLDFIVAQGWEEAVYTALVDELVAWGEGWDTLDLCNIHQDSPTLTWLPQLAEARGWTAEIIKEDVCPIIRLPATWDGYLEMLGGKQRHEIRRKLRHAEAMMPPVSWYIVGPEHDLEAEGEEFLSLMAASTPDKAAFLTLQMREFFRQLMRTIYDAGWLQLMFLKVGERKAAAYLNFVYNNRVLVYNSGLDWKAFPRLGAGLVLTAHAIRHAIEHGREVFDFLQGNERYKYQFGGQDVEVRRLIIHKA